MYFYRIREFLLRKRKPPFVCNFIDDYSVQIRLKNSQDKFGFRQKYKLDTRDIVRLCGGIPSNLIKYCEFSGTALNQDEYKATINYKWKGKTIALVTRIFDFKSRQIENHTMRCPTDVPYIGTSLFINEVIEARKRGFKRININAAGGVEYANVPGQFEGYHHWAKYGFVMEDDYQAKFNYWIKAQGRQEKNVQELVLKDEGKALWEQKGWHYFGYFDLSDRSYSMKHLRKYLVKKKINVRVV